MLSPYGLDGHSNGQGGVEVAGQGVVRRSGDLAALHLLVVAAIHHSHYIGKVIKPLDR